MIFASNRVTAVLAAIGVMCCAAAMPDIARAEEQRCNELGSNCLCSEPMNANDGAIAKGHDFSDSSSATGCTRFGLYYDSNKSSSNVQTVAERDMPSGNSVSYVLAIGPGGGGIVWLNGRSYVTPTDKRLCVRYYFQVDPNFSGAGPNNVGCPSERNKMLQFSFGNASPYQMVEPAGLSCTGAPGSGLSPYLGLASVQHGMLTGGNKALSPKIDWTDCFVGTGWCRAEACVHGNLSAGTNIYVDARVHQLSDGTDHDAINHGPVNPGQAVSLAAADLFHGQGIGPQGTRYVSHFMQAAWPTDAGQWIGAAYEIEDGSGGPPPPPPPPPSPPAAPLLLPQGQSSGGGETLDVNVSTGGGAPTVTALVTNGVGPYLFLFDCGLDGNWNGVADTTLPTATYTCAAGTGSVKAHVWDKGSDAVLDEIVTVVY